MANVITTDYDGCGKCLIGVRRLSRKTDATNSPAKQRDQILKAVEAVGAHIIAWADDIEVSGATDPRDRPGFGPWLRDEMGPYDGIAGAAVDRIGRNVRDVLNTAYANFESGRILVTADHVGLWDLTDPNQEAELLLKSMGAQLEHRAIRKRNQDETLRARTAGQPKQKPSYGYQFVRLIATGPVDHVEVDPVAAEIIRDVAERILNDETCKITCATEAARLTRAGVPSPADHRAKKYGRQAKGSLWNSKTIKSILTSEAALGYLMHGGRPVLGNDGLPKRLAEPLWDRAARDALITKTAPKRKRARAPKGIRMLSGIAYCGTCGQRLYLSGGDKSGLRYGCIARVRGIPTSQHCKPAPSMAVSALDKKVGVWFLGRYGTAQLMRRQFDPGTGYAARIAEIEESLTRLRNDREAGLYKSKKSTEWYQSRYAALEEKVAELEKLPERPPAMHWVPTGKTIADQWHDAPDNAARREILMSYDVRVTLFPGRGDRVHMTGVNPYNPTA